jgi:hypothetical protein
LPIIWITTKLFKFFYHFYRFILEREVSRAEARESQKQQQQAQPVTTAGPTTIVYQGGATMTALQVRKDKEAELFANDQYWANRLKNQESEFLKNSEIMEKEFKETVSVGKLLQKIQRKFMDWKIYDFISNILNCFVCRWEILKNVSLNKLWQVRKHHVKS